MSSDRRSSELEWLEVDGLGGFAMGTGSGMRTRRYHGLLLTATTPPTGRMLLVAGLEAAVVSPSGRFPQSTQHYLPDVVHPDGYRRLRSFQHEPWPTWTFQLENGWQVVHELFVPHGISAVALSWKLHRGDASTEPDAEPLALEVRPLLAVRDYHHTHHENPNFDFTAQQFEEQVVWKPYAGCPAVCGVSNGRYRHAPLWFRDFFYSAEHARGLDDREDLASPGDFSWRLGEEPAILLLATPQRSTDGIVRMSEPSHAEQEGPLPGPIGRLPHHAAQVEAAYERWRAYEQTRRSSFPSPLHRAADAYLVRRRKGRTIVAGYPWFTDWGRDTFISLRGLCFATGRDAEARDILLEWSNHIDRGMVPNRFPDNDRPEFNSVDASLWYVIAVGELLERAGRFTPTDRGYISPAQRMRLHAAIEEILEWYARGTRYQIRVHDDGLLACGEPGTQLTWMDAKIGDRVVTPRIGKPVEIEALWLNAIRFSKNFAEHWQELFELGRRSFQQRFWNESSGWLFDVVDVDHVAGRMDGALRPNQLFAVGGLPVSLVDDVIARKVVHAVETQLWTRLGPRTLATNSPHFRGQCHGSVQQRDEAYHQGSIWPWLQGALLDAWLKVHGRTEANLHTARRRFVDPLLEHLQEAGLGHVSEIADGDPPHTPRGCPFQAWSMSALLQMMQATGGLPPTAPASECKTGDRPGQ